MLPAVVLSAGAGAGAGGGDDAKTPAADVGTEAAVTDGSAAEASPARTDERRERDDVSFAAATLPPVHRLPVCRCHPPLPRQRFLLQGCVSREAVTVYRAFFWKRGYFVPDALFGVYPGCRGVVWAPTPDRWRDSLDFILSVSLLSGPSHVPANVSRPCLLVSDCDRLVSVFSLSCLSRASRTRFQERYRQTRRRAARDRPRQNPPWGPRRRRVLPRVAG